MNKLQNFHLLLLLITTMLVIKLCGYRYGNLLYYFIYVLANNLVNYYVHTNKENNPRLTLWDLNVIFQRPTPVNAYDEEF